MAGHWTLDDIPWDSFDASKADSELVKVIKAASLVEFNASDYAAYLENVFEGDPAFIQAAKDWAEEEIQHGEALARWAQMADASFDFDTAFKTFREGYVIDTDAEASVRGTRAGELVARCIVETGTSSFYSAIADATEEPVLEAISRKIAADELRHYKLFYTHLKDYMEKDKLGRIGRLRVALGRIDETEDDELAYAWYAANAKDTGAEYDRKSCYEAYAARAFGYYRTTHVERVVAMVFKACGLKPQGLFTRTVGRGVSWMLERRIKSATKLMKKEGLQQNPRMATAA